MTENMPKPMQTETPLGKLVAITSGDEAHPGIWVGIMTKDGRALPLALVECVDDEADIQRDGAYHITRVWKTIGEDEYSDRIVHEGV